MIRARVRCGQNSTLSLCLASVRAITNAIYSADSVHTTPAQATYWRTRTMAEHAGLSHTTVHRIWSAHELKPHRLSTFKTKTQNLSFGQRPPSRSSTSSHPFMRIDDNSTYL